VTYERLDALEAAPTARVGAREPATTAFEKLFDDSDVVEQFDTKVVVDGWGELFEQTAHPLEEHVFDSSTALPFASTIDVAFSNTDDVECGAIRSYAEDDFALLLAELEACEKHLTACIRGMLAKCSAKCLNVSSTTKLALAVPEVPENNAASETVVDKLVTSANTKALADYVHGKGSSSGSTRCLVLDLRQGPARVPRHEEQDACIQQPYLWACKRNVESSTGGSYHYDTP
jgi:hypothetical protein